MRVSINSVWFVWVTKTRGGHGDHPYILLIIILANTFMNVKMPPQIQDLPNFVWFPEQYSYSCSEFQQIHYSMLFSGYRGSDLSRSDSEHYMPGQINPSLRSAFSWKPAYFRWIPLLNLYRACRYVIERCRTFCGVCQYLNCYFFIL